MKAKFEDLKAGQTVRVINWVKFTDGDFHRNMTDRYEGVLKRVDDDGDYVVFERELYSPSGYAVYCTSDTKYEIFEYVYAPGYYTYRHPGNATAAVVHIDANGQFGHTEASQHKDGKTYFGWKSSDIVFVRIAQP